MKKINKVIIDIGHHPHAKGAQSQCDTYNEFDLNSIFAREISKELNKFNIFNTVVSRPNKSISSSVLQVNSISEKGDVIISLHCNAFNNKAQGSEVLYYHTSKNGKKLAAMIQSDLVNVLKSTDRGIKPLKSTDRGGYFLSRTREVAIIVESCFIDNSDDLDKFLNKMKELASRIADSVRCYLLNDYIR